MVGDLGRLHRESALELSFRLCRMWMCRCGGGEFGSRELPGKRHRGGRVQVRIRKQKMLSGNGEYGVWRGGDGEQKIEVGSWPASACAGPEQVLDKALSSDWISKWQPHTWVAVIVFIHLGS